MKGIHRALLTVSLVSAVCALPARSANAFSAPDGDLAGLVNSAPDEAPSKRTFGAGDWPTRAVFWALYKAFAARGRSWNLVATRGHGLEIAFPDSQATYFVTSVAGLRGSEAVTVKGRFPPWADYAAITAYNTSGLVVYSENFKNECCSGERRFELELTNEAMNLRRNQPFAIVYRIYRPLGKEWNDTSPAGLPEVFIGSDRLEEAPLTSAETWGSKLSVPLQKYLGEQVMRGYWRTTDANAQFYMPNTQNFAGIFPNADANYLIQKYAFENEGADASKTTVFILNGTLPANGSAWDFYGFMLTEASTTVTWTSTFQEQLGGWGAAYKVFVARSREAAVAVGYAERHGEGLLTCSVEDCPNPFMVFRQISTEKQGLRRLRDLADGNDVPAEVVMTTLGPNYPYLEKVSVTVDTA